MVIKGFGAAGRRAPSSTDPCQEFLVSIGPGDGRRDEPAPLADVFLGDEAPDFFDRLLMKGRIANDAALGDVLAAELELRLDEADDAPLPVQDWENGGQDLGQRDEGEIHHGEPDALANVRGGHVTGVELLLDDDAGVVAEFPDELVGADIDGVDAGGTALKQAVGEAAGGGSDIHAGPAGGIDFEGIERGFELEPAAADEAGLFLDFERRVERHLGAGFVDRAVAGAHLAGEDEALGLLAGIAEAAGDKKGIGAIGFHRTGNGRQAGSPAARKDRIPVEFPHAQLASCLARDWPSTIRRVTRHRTDDLRITGLNPLISPAVLAYYLPLTEEASEVVWSARSQAEAILRGEDDRLLAIVGPCSIHDPEAALEYGAKLKEQADRLKDDVLVIMRVYFEKPRTTVGWKGLINDPNLDDSFDINRGLRIARGLLLDLANMGMPAGTEFLDTISPQYIADLISWGAIGARTTESQVHRELASGLSMPVGFKNGTGGSIQIALDAIQSASNPHHFLSVTKQGVSAIVSTSGNASCHLILRGGKSGPNYEKPHIDEAAIMLREQGLVESVMVDCSHGNSLKDYRNQPLVAKNLANQMAAGCKVITSVMIESNLVEGNQKLAGDWKTLTRGQSVTDACLGWDETVATLEVLADAVRVRRALA
jgi:3-deoxy-7-phosphoheptulonate synthase